MLRYRDELPGNTAVHLHDGWQPRSMDDGRDRSHPGSTLAHVYDNDEPAATLRHHDHAMAATRLPLPDEAVRVRAADGRDRGGATAFERHVRHPAGDTDRTLEEVAVLVRFGSRTGCHMPHCHKPELQVCGMLSQVEVIPD